MTTPNEKAHSSEPWKPFPVEALPALVSSFVSDSAKGIGCDPTFIIMPLLAVFAAAIGSTRTLMLKPGWFAPAILWTVVIAESGSMKTPAHRLALASIMARQKKALQQQALAQREYERELGQHELELVRWKAKKDPSIPRPEEPIEPFAERCIVSDTTVEALAPILDKNPRGLLLGCDELAGWFGGFNAYKSGGRDLESFLSMYDAGYSKIDRKTAEAKTLIIRSAPVCMSVLLQVDLEACGSHVLRNLRLRHFVQQSSDHAL